MEIAVLIFQMARASDEGVPRGARAVQGTLRQPEGEGASGIEHAVTKDEHLLTAGQSVTGHVDGADIDLRIAAKVDQNLLIRQHKIQ